MKKNKTSAIQDEEVNQESLDRLEQAEVIAAVRRGIEDVKNGRTMPLRKAVAKLQKRLSGSSE